MIHSRSTSPLGTSHICPVGEPSEHSNPAQSSKRCSKRADWCPQSRSTGHGFSRCWEDNEGGPDAGPECYLCDPQSAWVKESKMKSVSKTEEIWFLSAKRTAFGMFGGSLKDLTATDLAVESAKAALAQARVSPEDIQHVVYGNVVQTSADAIYLPRHAGLRAGVPVPAPALGVNRLCASGFQALVSAAELMLTGQAQVILAGGTESMSQAPHIIRGARWGIPLGKGALEDSLWTALTDTYSGTPMAVTAENLAVQYKISQDEVDEYSVLSQKRFAAAQEAGRLKAEITPIELKSKKGTVVFERDEHNRPDTTVQGLKKLPKVFKKDGVVHAGAASGICDGAGSAGIGTRSWAGRKKLQPNGKLVNWGRSGVAPSSHGIGA